MTLFKIYNQKGFLYSQNTEDDWFGTEKKMIIIHQLHPILETFIIRLWVEAGPVFSLTQILLPAKRGLISHVIKKNTHVLEEIREINVIRVC